MFLSRNLYRRTRVFKRKSRLNAPVALVDTHLLETNATNYDIKDTAALYQQLKQDYNWFFDSLRCTLLDQLKSRTCNLKNLSIIDIACGDGNISKYIVENNVKNLGKDSIKIVGIDISESQVSLANNDISKYKDVDNCKYNIKYEIGDARNIKHQNEFDVAIAFWVFLYAPNTNEYNQMMKSCYQCLKPNGFVIGTTSIMSQYDQMDQFYDQEVSDKFGLKYVRDDNQDAQNGQLWRTYHGWTKNKKNQTFCLDYYFFNQNVQDKIAKNHGFKNGFEILDANEYTFGINGSMNDNEIVMAKEYFGLQQHYNMFVLTK